MWRSLIIAAALVGMHLPVMSYAAEKPSISDIDVRSFEDNSTDVFSIFQILTQARQDFQDEDFESAAKHYSLLVQYDALMEEPIIGLAKSQLALNRSDLAQTLLSKSSVSTPEIAILTTIATALNLTVEDREAYLIEALETSNDPRLWNLLGNTLIKNGKLQDAILAFNSAENAGQRPGLASNNLGFLYLHEGNIQLALQHFNIAVLAAPESEKFDNNRRLTLLCNGDYFQALDGLTSARSVSLLTDAAIVASKRDDKVLAQQLYNKAKELNPKHSRQTLE